MLGWVLYTSGAANHPELSPLRYTALSAIGGVGTTLEVIDRTSLGHRSRGALALHLESPRADIAAAATYVSAAASSTALRRGVPGIARILIGPWIAFTSRSLCCGLVRA